MAIAGLGFNDGLDLLRGRYRCCRVIATRAAVLLSVSFAARCGIFTY